MLTLVELLQQLKTLATSTAEDKLDEIDDLLVGVQAPAEFQVGRHYVARHLVGEIDVQLEAIDPAARLRAISTIEMLFPRNQAARVLRRVVKDPDMRVRRRVRRTIKKLGLDDVAPPDIRYKVTKDSLLGGYNPTGWAFGLFPAISEQRRKAKKPSRPEALDQFQLPKLANAADIAKLVGIEVDALPAMMRPGTEAGSGYVEFDIPKAKGGTRRIAAPRTPLRKVQRAILDKILAKIPMHDACHGFVEGRSTVTNAKPHEGAALVVKLDLKDFFPTVHYRRVRGLFQHLGYNEEVSKLLAALTTYRPKIEDEVVWPGLLPQGAPTSPALANLACRRLDDRLAKLAAKYGATYTRYADDLTFSFRALPDIRIGRFLWWVDGICQQEGFTERAEKRRILRAKHQQRVTGLVVNEKVNVPRSDRRRFRAILHNCAKHGVAAQAKAWTERAGRDTDFKSYLAGYAAYVNMVDPVLGKQYLAEVERLLGESNA